MPASHTINGIYITANSPDLQSQKKDILSFRDYTNPIHQSSIAVTIIQNLLYLRKNEN